MGPGEGIRAAAGGGDDAGVGGDGEGGGAGATLPCAKPVQRLCQTDINTAPQETARAGQLSVWVRGREHEVPLLPLKGQFDAP